MRICLTMLAWLMAATLAAAADMAERRIYGFSADGNWFAFAEYGVRDGSGAPYANLYVIDVRHDRWAPGTPVRIDFREREGTPGLALRKAERKAAPLLRKYGIAGEGQVLASRAATQIGSDPRQFTFYTYHTLRTPEHRHRFRLVEIDFPDGNECRQLGADVKGFTIRYRRGGKDFGVVYADDRVPASRFCPVRYELADVIYHQPLHAGDPPTSGKARFVLLIRYYRPGFEGLDGRYLAVVIFPREK